MELDTLKDTIKQKADIVSVVSSYIALKRTGANYKACCPFHDEKTESFIVSPSKQIFKCFGCGQAGDVIKFVQLHDKLSFIEALHSLAKSNNIEVEERHMTDEEKQRISLRQKFFSDNKATTEIYAKNLVDNEKAYK
jgi:DNA primase